LLESTIDSALIEVIVFFISILFSAYIVSKIHLKNTLINKSCFILQKLSYVIVIILLINFFNFQYQKKIANLSKTDENRNPVALIIIDGLPKKFIKNYSNNEKDINIISAEIKNDYVVKNYHKYITPSPWTCGFFSSLYGSSFKNTFRRDRKYKDLLLNKSLLEKNFFNQLDTLNVKYTWAVSHSCAVPEGSAAAISDYQGFKSILIFSKPVVAYLEKIGLPSHIIINMKMFKGEPTAVHLKDNSFVKKIIDIFSDSDDFNFQSHVLNVLRSSKKDLYIIHLNYSQWKDPELKNFKKSTDSLLKEINNFFKTVKEDSSFNNFSFIITADHGFSFYKEDFGYGISHRLEVLEPPFIIVKKIHNSKLQLSNVENYFKPCSVFDFKNSLVNFFETKKELFSLTCSADPKTSFSLADDKKKEWILSVFEKNNLKTYNLYNIYFGNEKDNKVKYFNKNNISEFINSYGIKY
jgi:hypothetical protein